MLQGCFFLVIQLDKQRHLAEGFSGCDTILETKTQGNNKEVKCGFEHVTIKMLTLRR